MRLDVRIPIGLLFLILGAILCCYGALSDPAIYALHSFGLNVNLLWGTVFALFGAGMLLLVWRSRHRRP